MLQLRIERRMLQHVPWGLLGVAVAIAAVGVFNLASAARPPHNPVWTSQALYAAIGLGVTIAVCALDYRLFHRMALPIYLVNIAALIALRFVGHTAKGAESWFVLGPIRVQPAEFMKIGVILMLARYYADTHKPNEPSYGLWRLLPALAIVFVPFALVLTQPDLGTAMMIFLSSATVIVFGRVKRWIVVVMAAGLLAGSAIIWNDFAREGEHTTVVKQHLKKHQVQRIESWLFPENDVRGASYHSMQSMIAVGSGELAGKGWKKGTQTGLSFLPEQHTDFIFSVWAEEHGFLACLLLLGLYGALLMATLGAAFTARDRFGAFVAVGVAAMLFWQVFQNIGMVIGVLPVTGITLPLMSYGGSSMVSVMLSLGLVANVAMRRHLF